LLRRKSSSQRRVVCCFKLCWRGIRVQLGFNTATLG
jgi:hypothetical protein